ncbi:MAG: S41 family peptidase [Flavobacterium sp.]
MQLFYLILTLLTSSGQLKNIAYQEKKVPLNLDAELVEKGKPVGWTTFGNETYKVALDSTTVKSGKYSLSISNNSNTVDYAAWSFFLPDNYKGKKIKLSGFLKTDNVTDGFAGLWLRLDPSVNFDNMRDKAIKGTNDWKEFSVELQMKPEATERIALGGLLVGKGTVWIDGLKVSIDGRDIDRAEIFEKNKFPADLDNSEFAEGSKIENFTPTTEQVANLKTLGLVWGFLKYYHPAIAKGNHNWDFELFRITPKILAAKNEAERDVALMDWINLLGDVKEGKPQILKPEEVKLMPDLDWLNTSRFSPELLTVLNKIKNAERSKDHYYIGFHPKVGNPNFKENSYIKISDPDAGYRLLSLFRYWNMIQYYFPNRHLIGEDWKNVLDEYIPKIIEAKDNQQYTIAMLEVIARIHDTHANIWGNNKAVQAYFGKNYAPVKIGFIEGKAVVTDYYNDKLGEESQLKKGDVITKINSKDVAEIIKEKLRVIAASNYPTQLRDLGPKLLRSNDSIMEITYLRGNQLFTQKMKTYPAGKLSFYKEEKDSSFKFIDKDIAYINHGQLKQKDLPMVYRELKKAKALIIDDRNYPSEFPLFQLGTMLVPNKTQFVKFSIGSTKTPGLFIYDKPTSVGASNKDYFKGKVIILVNETTQSSAEYHAMAYRAAPQATVMGSTTAGADGNVSSIALPGGISTMISGIGVYYPDGKETQRIGIVPDIEVSPTIEGIKSGKDEVLDKALEFAKS